VLVSLLVAAANAHSIELVSSDLVTARALDNIKGTWSQSLSILGSPATLTASYDRKAKKDFLKDATLKGKLDQLSYKVTTAFKAAADVTLSTTTGDGTTLEAAGKVAEMKGSVTKLTATKGVSVGGQKVKLALSHVVPSSTSKLQLSSALGAGLSAIGAITSAAGTSSASCEFGYETDLTPGRTLSATVTGEGEGEVEFVDTATVDATITATIPLGGQPRVTVKRAFKF